MEAAVHLGSRALVLARGIRPAVSAAGLGTRLGTMASLVGLGGAVSVSAHKRQLAERQLALEGRLLRELLAYLRIDLCPSLMTRSEFGRMMSQTIATRSSFARAAVMLEDATGVLCVAGSAGVDDLSVQALNRWGAKVAGSGVDGEKVSAGERAGVCSFLMQLERRLAPGARQMSSMSCTRVLITPLRSATGLMGALVVCAVPRPSVRELSREEPLARLVEPIEALALRLTMQLVRTPRQAVREVRPAPSSEVTPERERAADVERSGQEQGEASPEVGEASVRRPISMLERKGAMLARRGTGTVMGFPPARLWHNRPVSGELAAAPGGGVR